MVSVENCFIKTEGEKSDEVVGELTKKIATK
jgi:hypothetical protein